MSETFTIYVAKYALTKGIFEAEATFGHDPSNGYVYTKERYPQQFKLGDDAFRTREEALEKAEQMRVKKIASLKKQIANLEGMSFS